MAKRHIKGHVKGEPNNPICACHGNQYFNCGANCECCDSVTTTGGGELINPASSFGSGFDTSYDGRVRGGIKTPNMTRRSTRTTEFNIFNRQHETATNDYNSNASNSVQKAGRRLVKIHPLDIVKSRRVIGESVYDPISRTTKVDDGRPRGWFEDLETGQVAWACWGKCKVRKPFRTSVKCDCDKAGQGCACNGCLGGSAC